jgi:lipopolysaccharide export system permease protein
MNTLDRYLYRTVLVYTLMAMGVLLTLGALFLFISQQSDIGVGDYSAADAFLFTFLNLPQQAFELLPIGAMIGALMGLGNLASASELVVTRASGSANTSRRRWRNSPSARRPRASWRTSVSRARAARG